MLGNIWDAVSSIPNKIQELITSIVSILNYLNPFHESFIFKDFFKNVGEILNYLNPFHENFIFKDFFKNIGKILNYLNPFSEDFILKPLFNWLGDFFTELLNFFLHIFVPTDEQWEEIQNEQLAIKDSVMNHLPFIGLFSEELKKAQATVEKTDFLVITIPSFNYDGGSIKVNTSEQKCINVGQAYEPYRAYIRGFLYLIVVGLAFVYLIRYILNYGVVGSSSHIDTGDGKGGGK